jgi:ubiquinol-cytochrome c reductase cytochrome c subunit
MVERSGSRMERARSHAASRSRAGSPAGGLAALVVLAGLMWLLAPGSLLGEQPASPTAAGTVTQLTSDGQHLYLQSCASCHGTQGAGTANAPDIRNAGAALVDFVLRTGRMPEAVPGGQIGRGKPAFGDQDIQALVAYVSSLGTGPAVPQVVTEGADVAHGRELYVANCAACHAPGGGGGAVGGGFVAPGLMQADPRTVGEAVVSGPGPMPRFSFGPDELNALAGYIGYLQTEPHPGGASAPVLGPVAEGFIASIALVALLLVARWIGVRGRSEAPPARAARTHEGDPE